MHKIFSLIRVNSRSYFVPLSLISVPNKEHILSLLVSIKTDSSSTKPSNQQQSKIKN